MKNLSNDYKTFLKVEDYFAYKHLKECLKAEVQKGEQPFSWPRTIRRAIKCSDRRFYFWFRVYRYFFQTNRYKMGKIAKHKIRKLNRRYSIDINPRSTIGPGLKIVHFPGVVMRGNSILGSNVVLRQGVTIGARNSSDSGYSRIGDNVEIGTNACIIGDITIGNNVVIGAMSFINKDVPANSIVYSSNDLIIRDK